MADLEMNDLADRVQVYDAFVQLVDGSNNYKLKSLQVADPQFVWPMLDRISTGGELFLTPEISQHIHNQQLILTADEVDTVTPATNKRTISFFIEQKNARKSVKIVTVIVYTAIDATTNKFLRLSYTYEVLSIGIPRVNGDGDVVVDTTGRILPSTVTFVRSSTAPG